ncbi:MAG: siroheme synthase CysG [Paracoccaceae bacterium]
MQHFPIFLSTRDARVVLSGGGEAALAKLRLLLKTEAQIEVFAEEPASDIITWAKAGKIDLNRRALEAGDVSGAALFYAADEEKVEDDRTAAIARAEGALVNIVDNLHDSAFITPAIVDRDPVTVAIGTEGAAPVLARAIKADLEARLPTTLGPLARIGKAFRSAVEALPFGRARRDFWRDYYFDAGPRAIGDGPEAVDDALNDLLSQHLARETRAGHVAFVGAGPGDAELLTLKARKALDEADVVIHDGLVPQPILELARREAKMIHVGKRGFARSTPQEDINAAIVEHAANGAQVVRLKGGDPSVFARLSEETDACDAAGIGWHVVPGITAASAAAAAIGQSLTQRGRNSALRVLTGHDVRGFADHDWRDLARPGQVAAIYMGKKAARFIQGRLMMFGADARTPVSVVANASLPDQHVIASSLGGLDRDLMHVEITGPALILYGLKPHAAPAISASLIEEGAL